jgi:hypothetical protein
VGRESPLAIGAATTSRVRLGARGRRAPLQVCPEAAGVSARDLTGGPAAADDRGVGRPALFRLAVLAVVLAGIYGSSRSRAAEPGIVRHDVPLSATWTFDPSVTAGNQRAWLDSAARVRPAAARLFDRIDGVVTIEDGEPPRGALGVTIPTGAGRYTIRFRFGPVYQKLGQRGFDRLVHHELGHVVDAELLDAPLRARLNAGIPTGELCDATHQIGACTPVEERFAESFAKWANGDIGVNLYVGYAVQPPPDLEAWGRPLAALAAGTAPGS